MVLLSDALRKMVLLYLRGLAALCLHLQLDHLYETRSRSSSWQSLVTPLPPAPERRLMGTIMSGNLYTLWVAGGVYAAESNGPANWRPQPSTCACRRFMIGVGGVTLRARAGLPRRRLRILTSGHCTLTAGVRRTGMCSPWRWTLCPSSTSPSSTKCVAIGPNCSLPLPC